MNKIIIMLNYFISMNFFYMNHPLSSGLMLMLQTIFLTMICGMMSQSFWFAYILFLIMLGGMLVLFIYMTSMASNELIKFSLNKFIIMLMMFLMLMFMFMIYDNFYLMQNNMELNLMNTNWFFMNSENEINLIKLYNNPTMNITLLMINYLLMALIIIVKIIKLNSGPLRSNY
uniref:NADH-ubiquinone oxidoreductase chain 6 n=1 Tax=Sisyra aurorae TaxID=2835442 RepID=A0A8F1B8P9_9NEOP|nr:NADH dehydrogenase subunit 6 [Sisyra aurorae]